MSAVPLTSENEASFRSESSEYSISPSISLSASVSASISASSTNHSVPTTFDFNNEEGNDYNISMNKNGIIQIITINIIQIDDQ